MQGGHATVSTSRSNDNGFTLVEMMMATLITVVVLLGLVKAIELATYQNAQTAIRDEMAQVAETTMNNFRAMPFSMLSTCGNSSCVNNVHTYAPVPVKSNLRGIDKSYTVTRSTIGPSGGSTADLGVRVRSWAFKNSSTAIEVHTVVGQ